MGQSAAFTALHWALGRLLFPQCVSGQSYVEGVAATSCPALPARPFQPPILTLHTHPQPGEPGTWLSQLLHFLFHK